MISLRQAIKVCLKRWKTLETTLTTELNDLPAKLAFPIHPASSLLINLMLIY